MKTATAITGMIVGSALLATASDAAENVKAPSTVTAVCEYQEIAPSRVQQRPRGNVLPTSFLFELDEEYQFVASYVEGQLTRQRRWWEYKCGHDDADLLVKDLLVPKICVHLEKKAELLEGLYEQGKVKVTAPKGPVLGVSHPPDALYNESEISMYPDAYRAAYFYREVCHVAKEYNRDSVDKALEDLDIVTWIPFDTYLPQAKAPKEVFGLFTSMTTTKRWKKLQEEEEAEFGEYFDVEGELRTLLKATAKQVLKDPKTWGELATGAGKSYVKRTLLDELFASSSIEQRKKACPSPPTYKQSIVEQVHDNLQRAQQPLSATKTAGDIQKEQVEKQLEEKLQYYRKFAGRIPTIPLTCICEENAADQGALKQRVQEMQKALESLKYRYGAIKKECAATKESAERLFQQKYGHPPQSVSADSCAESYGYYEREHGFTIPSVTQEWTTNHHFTARAYTKPILNFPQDFKTPIQCKKPEYVRVQCPEKYECVNDAPLSEGVPKPLEVFFRDEVCDWLQHIELGRPRRPKQIQLNVRWIEVPALVGMTLQGLLQGRMGYLSLQHKAQLSSDQELEFLSKMAESVVRACDK